jgi:uncharacterized protein (DUF302 family)
MTYSYKKASPRDFEDTLEKIHEVLPGEGFGVLETTDFQAKLNEKMDTQYEKYTKLGICNPKLADQALGFEYEIGLFLPCPLIVYQREGLVFVSTLLPTVAMSVIDNEGLLELAAEVEVEVKRIVDIVCQK